MRLLIAPAMTTLLLLSGAGAAAPAADVPRPLSADEQRARDVYRELIEINTVTASGDTARAATAMADRLRGAGFADADIHVFTPAPRKGNLVARLRGTGKRRPLLLVAHLDVVEARRSDWTTDPFTLVEKDGWFYGRGTTDDKAMAAAFVANLIRYKREGFLPDRDLIVVLETDEEILDRDALGMQWLLANHRELIDAELALNEGGYVTYRGGKPVAHTVESSEKIPANFVLEVKSRGGHSSVPTRDNAIYRLSEGLVRLSRYDFPTSLDETRRAWFRSMEAGEKSSTAADIRSLLSQRPAPDAVRRLSQTPIYNAQLRTTCVATLLEGGHAFNALPQTARATVNCRILPDEQVEEVQRTIVRVLADEQISVTKTWNGPESKPSPIDPSLSKAIASLDSESWPGVPVVPVMQAGATDGAFLRNAGIPTYGHCGFRVDEDDIRAHGKDERMSVASFYQGTEYLYRLVKMLAGGDAATQRREVNR